MYFLRKTQKQIMSAHKEDYEAPGGLNQFLPISQCAQIATISSVLTVWRQIRSQAPF